MNVPEPEGFWTGPPKAYTPKTLTGATVVDIDALDKLVAAEKPVMIDVAMADQKPVGFPTDRPWLPAHRSIPGSVWMPGAGAAPMAPAREAQFLARVADLTGGDKSKPVVTFCHPECWGSWNAGKRLLQNGYTRVYWFADGVEGWQDRPRHHDPEGRCRLGRQARRRGAEIVACRRGSARTRVKGFGMTMDRAHRHSGAPKASPE